MARITEMAPNDQWVKAQRVEIQAHRVMAKGGHDAIPVAGTTIRELD
jgi:hypothetical protein